MNVNHNMKASHIYRLARLPVRLAGGDTYPDVKDIARCLGSIWLIFGNRDDKGASMSRNARLSSDIAPNWK